MISEENTHEFQHGRGWAEQRSDGVRHEGAFEESTTKATIHNDDLVNFRLDRLPEFMGEMAEGMVASIMRRMFAVVGEAAESVGNVVDGTGKSPAVAILESLRKVEFGVDRNGMVTMPEFHMPPEAFNKVMDDLNAQGPEFRAEIERLKVEKAQAALEREQQRLSRYKSRR